MIVLLYVVTAFYTAPKTNINCINIIVTGYHRDLFGGHLSVKTGPPNIGYHGEDGYRRNTPDLRRRKSVFDDEGE